MAGLQNRQQQLVPQGGALKRPRIESNDIITEILARLPVKSLIRFRCVCKSWRGLISHSDLVRKHLDRAVTGINPNSYRLLISGTPSQCIDLEVLKDVNSHVATRELHSQLPVLIDSLAIVGSCNGLICLKANKSDILLWNPSTRDTELLPQVTLFPSGPVFYGFGYDSSTEDYKVILGGKSTNASGLFTTIITVFALKSGSWRTAQDLHHVKLNGHGCLLNNVLHWLEFEWRGDPLLPVLSARIISFDLVEEKFQEMLPLSYLSDKKYISIRIGTITNRLFVYMYNDIITSDVAITMWVMKEYGVKESWAKITQIPSESLRQLHVNYLNPICILESDEVLMSCDSSYLVLYSPKKKTFRKVLSTPVNLLREVTMYVETLVSPVTGNGANI